MRKSEKQRNEDYLNNKGITLIALVITIIVLLILAGVTITTLTGDNGILQQAGNAKEESKKASYKEQIQIEYASLNYDNDEKTTQEKFELLKEKLNFEYTEIWKGSRSITIMTVDKFIFTLLEDGTVLDGKFAYLDIADGTIEIFSTYYNQNNIKYEYTGKYIITGKTKENKVSVNGKGNYDITIKDLNIDLSESDDKRACPFNALNHDVSYQTGVNVKIILQGKNILKAGGESPGLAFSGALANIDGKTTGSTLTIEGDGQLEVIGAHYSAGIGTGRGAAAGDANNITINSGTIKVTGGGYCGIGGAYGQRAHNIVINGGNIEAIPGGNAYGIDGSPLTINGGNIVARAGNYSCALNGENLAINGGIITATSEFLAKQAIGGENDNTNITITGGSIVANAKDGHTRYGFVCPAIR